MQVRHQLAQGRPLKGNGFEQYLSQISGMLQDMLRRYLLE
jgi:hypothetical protein